MRVIRAQQKREAIQRMKILRIMPEIIENFERKNILFYSEGMGILYWVGNNPEWLEHVEKFEKKYNALVYHAEFSRLSFGDCLSMLFVSSHKDEWKRDKENLKSEGYCIAYVKNLDDDSCSELGGIIIVPMNGGVKRTA